VEPKVPQSSIDIGPLIAGDKAGFSILTGGNEDMLKNMLGKAADALVRGLKPLCVFFPVKTIILDGAVSRIPAFLNETEKRLRKELNNLPAPKLKFAKTEVKASASEMAQLIRRQIISTL
jgi:hypothetical protein